MGIKIIGTGKYLPELIVKNDDYTKFVDTNDEWITTRTGIKTRHISTKVKTHQMASYAALDAIKNAGIHFDDIDLIIGSTVTADYITPSLASFVSNEIKAYNATCIDINCACAGFVYAIDLAHKYLQDSEYKNVLIVSSEILSKLSDYTDRTTCILFGDGAGACVVTKSDNKYSCKLGGDTTGIPKLFARGLDVNNVFMNEKIEPMSDGFAHTNGNAIYMDGKEVYKFATKVFPIGVELVCQKAGILPKDIDLIIPHQANVRIVETSAKNLNIPIEKFYVNIDKYGNTSSASIPICLAEAIEQNKIKQGDKVCMVGFGAGFTYGAVLIEF